MVGNKNLGVSCELIRDNQLLYFYYFTGILLFSIYPLMFELGL